MSDSASSSSIHQDSNEGNTFGSDSNQENMFQVHGEEGARNAGGPRNVIPGNFLGTVFLTIHISSNAIVTYLRLIPSPFHRMFIYCMISLYIASELIHRGLEHNPVSRPFISHSIPILRQSMTDLVEALEEIDEGHPREMMFGMVMRIVAELACLI